MASGVPTGRLGKSFSEVLKPFLMRMALGKITSLRRAKTPGGARRQEASGKKEETI
jgi:hypothetical protein